jgi:putative methionine-R-sulfoxide reductase with GAF domain
MMSPEISRQTDIQNRAVRKLMVIVIATYAIVAFYLYLGFTQDQPAILTVAVILALYGVVAGVCVWLIRNGRVHLGMWIAILGMYVVFPLTTLIISGLGIILGLSLPLLVTLLAADVLNRRQTTLAIIGSVVFGIITILLDMFWPTPRAEVLPIVRTFLPAIVVTLVILYGVLIARRYKNYSMSTKLISATAFVAIVAVLAVTIIVDFTTRSALINEVGNNLNTLAKSQALAVGELLSRQVNTLEALALNRAVRNAVEARNLTYGEDITEEEAALRIVEQETAWGNATSTTPLVLSVLNNSTSDELLTFRRSFPEHTELILTDRFGALVAATDFVDQYDYRRSEWWEDAYLGGFGSIYVGEPRFDERRDTYVIDIAVPVRTETAAGRSVIAGVLRSSFRVNSLARVLQQARFGETGNLEMHFDDSQELAVAADGSFEIETMEEEEERIVDRLSLEGLPFAQQLYNGVESFVSQDQVNTLSNEPRIDTLGWSVVVVQAAEESLRTVTNQRRTNIILGTSIIVFASIVAAVVARFLVRPIVNLTNTAVKVAEGDLSARAVVTTTDEIGTLAQAFNQMTSQLEISISDLESRVADRTKALAASAEVSRSLSTILDADRLVLEVVDQIQHAFDYYHVQIYLFNPEKTVLEMHGGSGEAGQAMLASQHSIPAGRGLVGRAAATAKAVIISDVTQASDWLPSPLLPDTRAEIAVPIMLGEEVTGVLDVQDDEIGGLTEEDAGLLQAVANQVAIALQNARAYDQVQQRALREAQLNEINLRIQQASSIDSVLKIAAEELGKSLRRSTVNVRLESSHLAVQHGDLLATDGVEVVGD